MAGPPGHLQSISAESGIGWYRVSGLMPAANGGHGYLPDSVILQALESVAVASGLDQLAGFGPAPGPATCTLADSQKRSQACRANPDPASAKT